MLSPRTWLPWMVRVEASPSPSGTDADVTAGFDVGTCGSGGGGGGGGGGAVVCAAADGEGGVEAAQGAGVLAHGINGVLAPRAVVRPARAWRRGRRCEPRRVVAGQFGRRQSRGLLRPTVRPLWRVAVCWVVWLVWCAWMMSTFLAWMSMSPLGTGRRCRSVGSGRPPAGSHCRWWRR